MFADIWKRAANFRARNLIINFHLYVSVSGEEEIQIVFSLLSFIVHFHFSVRFNIIYHCLVITHISLIIFCT